MTDVETARELLVALTSRYAFREVAALIGLGAGDDLITVAAAADVQQLCSYGQRLLDLDAEDLHAADAADGATVDTTIADRVTGDVVPEHLLKRGRACRMPQHPREGDRGAMGSLRPVFALLLEIMAVRWLRRETAALLAAAHIAAEYAPMLVWERVLGHAADPARLAQDPIFTGEQSRFGQYDEPQCQHTKPETSATNRALRTARENALGWQHYLNRQHSTVAHALGNCAVTCRTPCSVLTSRSDQDRAALTDACRLAFAYSGCALIRLRHSAPVGHGFGVPSPAEVTTAWQHSRQTIAKHGPLGPSALTEDGFVLPGMPSMFTAFAGVDLRPDTLLADTAREVVAILVPG
jgi:hypothetical protein